MKVAIFSVVLNIHQVGIADELFELTDHDFVFVELEKPVGLNNKGGSEDFSSRPYLLQSWRDADSEAKAMEVARKSEVVILGGHMALKYQIERLKENRLTFEMGERWLKHWQSCFSPRLLKNIWNYHIRGWKNRPLYKLCSSSYCANDQYLFRTFKGRCYKWGYFTKVEEINIEDLIDLKHNEKPMLMWCARFLDWKHPEMVVKLARRLRENNYDVQIDMYGTGVERSKVESLAIELGVDDMISFKGNVPNENIISAMHKHDIFLFTSDKNEGWGAVLNEAMSNGCTVVASCDIGAVPFLIKDGENGMVFHSKSIYSLFEKVVYLLDHPAKRIEMSLNAYRSMRDLWSPRQAAINFLQLTKNLLAGKDTSIDEGPCSKAYPYKYK